MNKGKELIEKPPIGKNITTWREERTIWEKGCGSA